MPLIPDQTSTLRTCLQIRCWTLRGHESVSAWQDHFGHNYNLTHVNGPPSFWTILDPHERLPRAALTPGFKWNLLQRRHPVLEYAHRPSHQPTRYRGALLGPVDEPSAKKAKQSSISTDNEADDTAAT
jgi:hypothetical protein